MGAECYQCVICWRLQLVSPDVQFFNRDLLTQTDNWDRNAHRMVKNDFGVWEIVVPAINGGPAIPHNSKVKVGYFHLLLYPWITSSVFPNVH